MSLSNDGFSQMTRNQRFGLGISDVCRRMKWFLLFIAILYVISFLAGCFAIWLSWPFAVELRDSILQTVARQAPFTTVTDVLRSGQLLLAITLTFVVNLCSGAFLSTTLIGIVPLLGAAGVSLVTFFRGFSLGIVYYGVLGVSPGAFVLGAGTLIFELGGYVFSAAGGISLSLAIIFPNRYGVESRWLAFRKAWRDVARLYLMVVGLLLVGAVWEMTGLFLLLGQR
jgi:hypothetical protein